MPIFGVFPFLKFQYLGPKVTDFPKIVAGYVKCPFTKNILVKLGQKLIKKIHNFKFPLKAPIGGGLKYALSRDFYVACLSSKTLRFFVEIILLTRKSLKIPI
jgi:hypothetical protein